MENVAPHDGCVDWNKKTRHDKYLDLVVAPHDGCVDWNLPTIIDVAIILMSHPTMGAWIEIDTEKERVETLLMVAPHDGCVDWNNISYINIVFAYGRRTPRWVRGLKFIQCIGWKTARVSHPTMGAWIEIIVALIDVLNGDKSHPTMGAWIEIDGCSNISVPIQCRTPRWVRGLKLRIQATRSILI